VNKIERLSRMRRNILLFVLAGTGIAAALLVFPEIVRSGRYHWWPAPKTSLPFYYGAFLIWAVTLFVFGLMYMMYKRKLKKDPALRAAIDDERVRANWLRAYRFAFFTIVIIAVLMKLAETAFAGVLLRGGLLLPDRTWFFLSGALLALVSSFLFYNRGTQDE